MKNLQCIRPNFWLGIYSKTKSARIKRIADVDFASKKMVLVIGNMNMAVLTFGNCPKLSFSEEGF